MSLQAACCAGTNLCSFIDFRAMLIYTNDLAPDFELKCYQKIEKDTT